MGTLPFLLQLPLSPNNGLVHTFPEVKVGHPTLFSHPKVMPVSVALPLNVRIRISMISPDTSSSNQDEEAQYINTVLIQTENVKIST